MNISAFRYYSKFYRGSYHRIILSIAGSILQSIIIIAIPFLIRYVFDDVIKTKDFKLLASIGIAIIVLYIIECTISLYVRHIVIGTTKDAVLKLRQEILNKFYSLSRKYYSEANHSKMHDIAVHDTERVDIMSNSLVAYVIPAVIICVPLGVFLFYLSYLLFLLMLIALPLFLGIIVPIRRKLQKRVGGFHGAFEVFSKGVMFVLEAMDLTRVRVAEDLELKKQSDNLEELRDVSGSMAWFASAYISIQRTIYASTGVVILIVGGIFVIRGRITLGDLISFFVALSFMKAQVHLVVFTMPHIIEGSESLSRLYEFIDIKEPRPYTGKKRIDFTGKISLESVHFQYDRFPVLHGIDLTIDPGTTVAVVGANGAGKTSIAHLILGFYRPGSGRLYADGHPYSELDISHLRRYIGVVTQNPIIFAGTIRENISYGCPGATLQEVIRAAELATAHEFIQNLPNGYDTPVGEGGVLLSGGQRQRIAIARALLGKPRLLILDEPTNNLDATSVGLIIENLKSLDHIKSTLIISHEADIVRQAQHINILQEGRIVSSGSYASISPQAMRLAGVY